MSSQPNQSLIDGIRCLQYLVSSDRAIGCRELARLMGINPTRVNRLLMTMAAIGLTTQDEQRRYLPGPGIHALAAQAIRGSTLFSNMMPACQSVIGIALLAAESDEVLAARFSADEMARIAPFLQQQRQQGHVVWPHDDGELSLAQPIQFGSHKAALAFAGMYDVTPEQTASRLAELVTLCDRLTA